MRQEVAPLGITTLLVEPGPFRTDWAGRSANETLPEREIADYAETVGAQRAAFRADTGNEPGDPAAAARALLTSLAGATRSRDAVCDLADFDGPIEAWEATLICARSASAC
ncbi:hypothetical protein OG933_43345 [Streptomyces sp. NBC_00016]|uniref:hypothetical protein n=1 Tax=Streptomyces sp. NBC_00016 TaxID=2975622 RepID=UPI00324ADF31